jgi:hemoglobin
MLGAMAPGSTMFDRVGGTEFFDALTKRFYAAVRADEVLRPMYPSDDAGLESSRVHLMWFLVQFWGGPRLYEDGRGQPRLRMRHAHLSIGVEERDAWVRHMSEAVRAAALRPLDETQMLAYLTSAASHMVNAPPPGSAEG